jgi:hypothetical protein
MAAKISSRPAAPVPAQGQLTGRQPRAASADGDPTTHTVQFVVR